MSDVTWAQFARSNVIPVWPDMWNRWQILTTALPEDASARDVAEALIPVMQAWCGGLASASKLEPSLQWRGSRLMGAADEVRIKEWGGYADVPDLAVASRTAMTEWQRTAGAQMNRLDAPGPLQTLEEARHVTKIVVSFVWRSNTEVIPWPVWRDAVLGSNLEPIAKKEWLVDRVLEPSFGAPREETLLDSMLMPAAETVMQNTNDVTNAAQQVAQAAQSVASWGFAGALLLIGGGVAIWLAPRVARRR